MSYTSGTRSSPQASFAGGFCRCESTTPVGAFLCGTGQRPLLVRMNCCLLEEVAANLSFALPVP